MNITKNYEIIFNNNKNIETSNIQDEYIEETTIHPDNAHITLGNTAYVKFNFGGSACN